MKLLFLGRYDYKGASSRYRIYQYLPFFNERGINSEINYLLVNGGEVKSVTNLIKSYSKRLILLIKYRKTVLVYVEKEFFPFCFDFLFLIRLLNIKYIVDYDDATFHTYDLSNNLFIRIFYKNKISKVIKYAKAVVTGSPYLTQYAIRFNRNVIELPTSVLFKKYEGQYSKKNDRFVIGWIGSKSTSLHLISIKDALNKFLLTHDCEIHLIGFDQNLVSSLVSTEKVKVFDWSEADEVERIYQFTVGIMPLPDKAFERGKCGLKLIQYMACGIPTISTPLETNIKINRGKKNLFASTTEEWFDCLLEVFLHRPKYVDIGKENIEIVKNYYSIEANLDKYISLFNEI